MEKIKIDDILRYKFLASIKHSPNGKYLCFVVHQMDYDENCYFSNLWIFNTEDESYYQLTSFNTEKAFLWIDNECIIFNDVRDKNDKSKKDLGVEFTQYYKINIHGGEAIKFFSIPMNVNFIKAIDNNTFIFTSTYDQTQKDLSSMDEYQKEKELKVLPWPGRYDRAGWKTILVSWLLMLLLAALAVLIAILIFRNQPPQTPPTPTGGSGSPPPQSQSGSPPPQSGSPSPQSGSPSASQSGSESGSPVGIAVGQRVRFAVGVGLELRLRLALAQRHRVRRRSAEPGRVRLTGRQHTDVEALAVPSARPCEDLARAHPEADRDRPGRHLPVAGFVGQRGELVGGAGRAGSGRHGGLRDRPPDPVAGGDPGSARRTPDGDRQQRRGPLRRGGRRDDRPDHHRHRRGPGRGDPHPYASSTTSGSPSSRAPGSVTNRTTRPGSPPTAAIRTSSAARWRRSCTRTWSRCWSSPPRWSPTSCCPGSSVSSATGCR